ncbi:MAG TPA: hypothetical protein ENH25_11440 [candidate division Zixibacteria bacterium]|nr:hypothetical protein [candidate division Zixibacteria bacterium]
MKTALFNKKDKIESRPEKPGRFKLLPDSIKIIARRRIGRTIAVYIDDNSLQFAVTRQTIFGSKLVHVSKIYIPRSLKDEKRHEYIINKIKEYTGKYDTKSTHFILGVGGPKTAFRIISLPRMNGRELAEAIYWEGGKRIPFGLDKAYYGYRINENFRSDERDTISASLIAVLKSDVGNRLEMFDSLNIKIGSIHHELEAIGNMLPYVDNFDHTQTYALINIKKNSSEISFYRGTKLEFTHISSVGSETLSSGTDSILKYEYFTEMLVNEIQHSIDYYIGQFSNTTTDTVFVYGDLSYSDELIDNLTSRFGIKFQRFPTDRWLKMEPEIEAFVNQIPVSLSTVALAVYNPELIDFLPPEQKEKRKAKAFIRSAVPAFLTLITVLSGFWGILKYENYVNDIRLDAARTQTEMFRSSPTYSMYNAIKTQMAADRMVLEKLNQKPTALNLNLKELSLLAPEKIKLDLYDLQVEENKVNIRMTGHAISSDPPPEIILAEFIARLQDSPFFNNVKLDRHNKMTHNDGFVIDFQIGMDAVI